MIKPEFSVFIMKAFCLLRKFFSFSVFDAILKYLFSMTFYRCTGINERERSLIFCVEFKLNIK